MKGCFYSLGEKGWVSWNTYVSLTFKLPNIWESCSEFSDSEVEFSSSVWAAPSWGNQNTSYGRFEWHFIPTQKEAIKGHNFF